MSQPPTDPALADFAALPLTWQHRPHLPHIDYAADSTAVLRARLLARLAQALPQWNAATAPAGTAADEIDFAPLLAQAFAGMSGALNSAVDAQVNENWLGTATQLRSLLDLAALGDTRPRPAAAAGTTLAFVAKPGKSGRVPAGFAVSAAAAQRGAEPVVFETAQDCDIDARRNRLRLYGADRSSRLLRLAGNPAATQDTGVRLTQALPALRAGMPLLIDDGGAPAAVMLTRAQVVDGRSELAWAAGTSSRTHNFAIADSTLRARPQQTMRPAAAARADELTLGSHRVPVQDATIFDEGMPVLVVSDGIRFAARVARVTSRGGGSGELTLARPLPASLRRSATRVAVGRLISQRAGFLRMGTQQIEVGNDARHFSAGDLVAVQDDSGVELISISAVDQDTVELAEPLLRALRHGSHRKLKLYRFDAELDPREEGRRWTRVPPLRLGEQPEYSTQPRRLLLDRAYDNLAPGTPLALHDGSRLMALRLAAVELEGTHSALEFETAPDAHFELARLQVLGPFEYAARVEGWDRSEATLAPGATQIELAGRVEGLAPGHWLVLADERAVEPRAGSTATQNSAVQTVAAEGQRIARVQWLADRTQIALARPLVNGYALGSTVVYGNAAAASAGSAVQEVLGSGDALQSGQRFTLRRAPLAFVADASAGPNDGGGASGMRAELTVLVDGEAWTLVDTLAASGPTDRHVALQIDEAGRATLQFGDGRFGARCASGRNNVVARYRSGGGLAGNADSGRIRQPVQALPFIERVFNPADASGGAPADDVPSLRRALTLHLRTLERAVSLQDHADLAAGFTGIAQAIAHHAREGRRRVIVVTAAAAGGAAVAAEHREALQSYLAQRSGAAAPIRVRSARRQPLRLALEVSADASILRAELERRLWAALGADGFFAFERQSLGTDLMLSSVYLAVEQVPGVAQARALAFHTEGEAAALHERIAIAADAFASGGDPTDPARGRLSIQILGGLA